ncbi:MAG: ABC transporter permease [Chloroflexi bacterium]|nr:ABC transporter permease [Chloroflexota bacterium]
MSIRRIFALAWKDMVDSVRTPRLMVIIITPLIVSLFIQIFFGDKMTLRLGFFSPTSTQIVSTLEQVDLVQIEIFDSLDNLIDAINNKKVIVGVVLQEDFDRLLSNNEFPEVDFYLADNSQEAQMGLSLVQQTIQAFSPVSLPIKTSITILEPDILPGISLRGDLSIDQYALILWLVMGMVGNGVMLVPTLIVDERERKTLDALLLSPASYSDVAAGKAIVGVIYSLVSSSLILLVQGGIPGNYLLLAALIFGGSLSLSLLGLLIGNLAKNLHALNSYGGLFVFLLIFPAVIGLLGPNPIIQYLQFLPTYPIVQGIVQIVSGQAEKAWPSLFMVLGQCLLISVAVVWSLSRYKRK